MVRAVATTAGLKVVLVKTGPEPAAVGSRTIGATSMGVPTAKTEENLWPVGSSFLRSPPGDAKGD